MKVLKSEVGTTVWNDNHLWTAYEQLLPEMEKIAENIPEECTVCIILCDPEAEVWGVNGLPKPGPDTIWVSPLMSFGTMPAYVTRTAIWPPGQKRDGKFEARTNDQFLSFWRETLERALAHRTRGQQLQPA